VTEGAVVGADASEVYQKVKKVADRLWEKASADGTVLPAGVKSYLKS
jgi:hypothetical protein